MIYCIFGSTKLFASCADFAPDLCRRQSGANNIPCADATQSFLALRAPGVRVFFSWAGVERSVLSHMRPKYKTPAAALQLPVLLHAVTPLSRKTN